MKRHIKKVIKGVIAATIALGVVQSVSPQGTYAAQAVTDYSGHAYKSYIEYTIQNKLMWLYPDGNFRPNQPVTQADLVVSLSTVKGLTVGTPVTELPGNHWAKVYYERAKKDGLLEGVPINPGKILNREEASKLMVNAWKNLRSSFKKTPQYYIGYAVDAGWIPPRTGVFPNGVSTTRYDTTGALSRGEQALALYNLHRDFLGIKEGEKIATQFHNSLKLSGGILRGNVPSVKGYDIRFLVRFKDGTALTTRSGAFSFNANQAKRAQFTVKRAGESRSLAVYEYEQFPSTTRVNSR